MDQFVLGVFIPKTKIDNNNNNTSLKIEFDHYDSIEENYKQVEEFLDAPLFENNKEMKVLRKERQEVIKRINEIRLIEINQLNSGLRIELQDKWSRRRELNKEMNTIIKKLPSNTGYYINLRKILKRIRVLRRLSRNDETHYFKVGYKNANKEINQLLTRLYLFNRYENKEIIELLIELNLKTITIKRLSLVIEEVSPLFEGVNGEERRERCSSILEKIVRIQMKSLLNKQDLEVLDHLVKLLREVPQWNYLESLKESVFIPDEGFSESGLPLKERLHLRDTFTDPPQRLFFKGELILFDDERIFSQVIPVEDREELSRFILTNEFEIQEIEISEVLLKYRKKDTLPNCRIEVLKGGQFFLEAIDFIEVGELLKCEFSFESFLRWGNYEKDEPFIHQVSLIEKKIAELEIQSVRLESKDPTSKEVKLEKIDTKLRIEFLQDLATINNS